MARAYAAAALAICLGGSLGGCADHGGRMDVDRGAAEVHGDYMGSRRGVKLFVETIALEPLRHGRGSLLTAELAVLNERGRDIRFETGRNKLELSGAGSGSITPIETHSLLIRNGQLMKFSLTFRTQMPIDDVYDGTLRIEGIEADAGQAASFSVPFSSAPE